ncbi:hypothetical protein Q5752_001843 [Cryptotrichosporon argae]
MSSSAGPSASRLASGRALGRAAEGFAELGIGEWEGARFVRTPPATPRRGTSSSPISLSSSSPSPSPSPSPLPASASTSMSSPLSRPRAAPLYSPLARSAFTPPRASASTSAPVPGPARPIHPFFSTARAVRAREPRMVAHYTSSEASGPSVGSQASSSGAAHSQAGAGATSPAASASQSTRESGSSQRSSASASSPAGWQSVGSSSRRVPASQSPSSSPPRRTPAWEAWEDEVAREMEALDIGRKRGLVRLAPSMPKAAAAPSTAAAAPSVFRTAVDKARNTTGSPRHTLGAERDGVLDGGGKRAGERLASADDKATDGHRKLAPVFVQGSVVAIPGARWEGPSKPATKLAPTRASKPATKLAPKRASKPGKPLIAAAGIIMGAPAAAAVGSRALDASEPEYPAEQSPVDPVEPLDDSVEPLDELASTSAEPPAPAPAEPEPEPDLVSLALFSHAAPYAPHFSRAPQVVYTTTPAELADLLACLEGDVVGFDMEWPATGKEWDAAARRYVFTQGRTAMIQVCDHRMVVLYHLRGQRQLPQCLVDLVTSPMTLKAGVNIRGDALKLARDFPAQFPPDKPQPAGLLELGKLARAADPALRAADPGSRLIALGRLAGRYLGKRLDKDGPARQSEWDKVLGREQIDYAANDVFAGLLIYAHLAARLPWPLDHAPFLVHTGAAAELGPHLAHPLSETAKLLPSQARALALWLGGRTVPEVADEAGVKQATALNYVLRAMLVAEDHVGPEHKKRLAREVATDTGLVKPLRELLTRLRALE